jgi:uncharacterized protein with ParB-like and HNH nuclease domain
MKTIQELRANKMKTVSLSSTLKHIISQNIDWDVYLPTKGKNLQRGLVWDISQKRELFWSVLMGRHIPAMAFINIVDPQDDGKEIWQIIDGKQRLSSLIGFISNDFTLIVDGKEYFYTELPADWRNEIRNCYIKYDVVHEQIGNPITDEAKITWFKAINFAGTEQDRLFYDNL